MSTERDLPGLVADLRDVVADLHPAGPVPYPVRVLVYRAVQALEDRAEQSDAGGVPDVTVTD